MDFLKLVTDARTCRRFDGSRQLEPDALSQMVNCARVAPCTGNTQTLRYLLVQTPEKCKEFYPSLVWAAYLKNWDGPAENERPTGYMVLLAPAGEDGKISTNGYIDTGIMGQTIQLAAWAKGIGACMFRGFSPKKIAAVLPIPHGYEIALVIAFGYPVEERRIVPVEADGSIRYYRDNKGIHCVPKRELRDIILGEF